jgi:hypothetical protein
MATFLGFLTALIIVAYGIHWYFSRAAREWPEMINEGTRPLPPSMSTFDSPPLMPRETAEKLMQERERQIMILDTDPKKPVPRKTVRSSPKMVMDSLPSGTVISTTPTMAKIKLDVATRNARDRQGRIMGFCARCRVKREVGKPTLTRTKKGKSAIRGHCTECGAGMFIFTLE